MGVGGLEGKRGGRRGVVNKNKETNYVYMRISYCTYHVYVNVYDISLRKKENAN